MKGIFFSTTKFILALLSINLAIFTYLGIIDSGVFENIVYMVFGYFFHKNGIEHATDKTISNNNTLTIGEK